MLFVNAQILRNHLFVLKPAVLGDTTRVEVRISVKVKHTDL